MSNLTASLEEEIKVEAVELCSNSGDDPTSNKGDDAADNKSMDIAPCEDDDRDPVDEDECDLSATSGGGAGGGGGGGGSGGVENGPPPVLRAASFAKIPELSVIQNFSSPVAALALSPPVATASANGRHSAQELQGLTIIQF